MVQLGCLPFLVILFLLLILPFLFAQVMISALVKLHLSPGIALMLVMGIFLGSLINIPVKRILRGEEVVFNPLAMFAPFGMWPQFQRIRRETIIAVNVGGCVIPASVAIYETVHLLWVGIAPFLFLAAAVLINTVVCYRLARPMKGIGIAMPALIPPLVAVLSAMILAPGHATPVAFVAGVMGPLIGADLLHLREIPRIATGMASIGGAGTFDGIVLSGILAAYLA